MGKAIKRNDGHFLEKKLSDKKLSLIHREFQVWHTAAKKKGKQPLEMSMDLCNNFIRHLGIKDKSFRRLPSRVLKTTNEGFRQIYEYVRKRVGHKVDEKPATPGRAEATPKTPSPKTK